jgi:subtilisin family serine protease
MRGFTRPRRIGLLAFGSAAVAALAVGLLLGPLRGPLFGSKQRIGKAAAPGVQSVEPVGPTVLLLPKPRPPSGTLGSPPQAGMGAKSGSRVESVPGQLLVKFRDGTTPQTANRLLGRVEGDVDHEVNQIDVQVVSVPGGQTDEAVHALDASPAVEYVERDTTVTAFGVKPNDPLWPNQWGSSMVRLPDAWSASTGSARVVIAVLDSGIDPAHPDLRGAVLAGRDLIDGDDDPDDQNGHGTATAGVIASRTNNRLGQAGVCWTCAILPVKVLDAKAKGPTSVIAAGIVWAADHGARVINMSIGTDGPTQTLEDAVNYAQAKGAMIVASAGNNGSATPVYPAAYANVLSVAGSTAGNALYSWSSYGPWVSVAAPGCNAAPWLNGGFVNYCGTSSAAPIVAGIAGLAFAARPATSVNDITQAIEKTATALPGTVRYGLVNAQAALSALGINPRRR